MATTRPAGSRRWEQSPRGAILPRRRRAKSDLVAGTDAEQRRRAAAPDGQREAAVGAAVAGEREPAVGVGVEDELAGRDVAERAARRDRPPGHARVLAGLRVEAQVAEAVALQPDRPALACHEPLQPYERRRIDLLDRLLA